MANLDLSATLELIDRVSAPLQGMIAQSERLNQAFAKTTQQVEQFSNSLSQINNARLTGLTQPLNQTNSLFGKARQNARGLASDLKLVFSAIMGVQKKLKAYPSRLPIIVRAYESKPWVVSLKWAVRRLLAIKCYSLPSPLTSK